MQIQFTPHSGAIILKNTRVPIASIPAPSLAKFLLHQERKKIKGSPNETSFTAKHENLAFLFSVPYSLLSRQMD
jgi:hypothetical protein